MTGKAENWACAGIAVIIVACLYAFYYLGYISFRCTPNDNQQESIKPKSIPQKIGILYTHQIGQVNFGIIPIQKYTFLSGSVIEAISVDGRRIISNSCTLILENEN